MVKGMPTDEWKVCCALTPSVDIIGMSTLYKFAAAKSVN